MKQRFYCFFCRKFKDGVERVRLRFGEIHICRDCAPELKCLLEKIIGEAEGDRAR